MLDGRPNWEQQLADEGVTLPGIKRILDLESEVADLQEQLAESS